MSDSKELPCEYAARVIFPSIRAVMAKILIEEHGLSGYSAAKILGLTPAAVTQYLEGKRGRKYVEKISSNENIVAMLREATRQLIREYNKTGSVSPLLFQRSFCAVCVAVNEVALDLGCPATNFFPASKKL